jgi:hypothetical protein
MACRNVVRVSVSDQQNQPKKLTNLKKRFWTIDSKLVIKVENIISFTRVKQQ